MEAAVSEGQSRRRLTTVLAADICGYSRLSEIDEDAAITTVRAAFRLFEQTVEKFHGRVFNQAGDGFFAEFPSVADGVNAALAFVSDWQSRDAISPNLPNAGVRAGLHVGDVADAEKGDILGHGVNIAARLQGEAEPNGVLVSLHAVNLVRGKMDVRFRRRGPLALKNIDQPVVAFDVEQGEERFAFLYLFNAKVRRYWRGITAVAILSSCLIFFFSYYEVADIRKEAKASTPEDARADIAMSRINPKSETDTRRLKAILMDIARSDTALDKEVFAHIEKGDLTASYNLLISAAEASRATGDIDGYVGYLRKAGAIVFDDDAEKARLALERIVDLNSQDFYAHSGLGRLNYTQSRSARSNWHFEKALEIGTENIDDIIYTEINYATSKIVQERYDEAYSMLEKASRLARANGFDSLVSRAQSVTAYAQMKQKKFSAAEETINAILPLQAARNFDADRAVSLGTLGRIAQSRGENEKARKYFEQVFALEEATGRALGMTDMLYYIGLTSADLGELDDAARAFERGVNIARRNNMINMQIKNIVGLSYVEKKRGNDVGSCEILSRAVSIHTDDIVYNPWTREVIASLGCSFPPLALD